MAKVTPRSEESNALTSGQLQKLHAALEEALETTAVNTTVQIATTLKQENATSLTYLCIAIAKSNPGLDTKRSMRPFLKYLDTDEVLELKVGKLGFKAALTTQAKIWIVRDTNSDSFKACC